MSLLGWLTGSDDRHAREASAAAQARADAEARTRQEAINTLRTNSTGAARTNANTFFTEHGLDPSRYSGDIEGRINEILSTTPLDDPNVGSYFSNLGQSVYDNRTNAERSNALRSVNNVFGNNFEASRIADTADDPYLAQIGTDQRSYADSYITNLLKRHVITQTGADSAEHNLDEQGSRVRSQLNNIGGSLIGSGRQSLTDIANHGRQDASTINLGATFDPSTYGQQADTATSSFLSGLGDSIKSQLPGDLYDTRGLAAIAGTAQGAGNTNFDPRALAGLNINDNEDPLATPATKRRGIF